MDRAVLDPDGIFPLRLAGDRAALVDLSANLWALAAEVREKRLRRMATLAHRLAGAAGTFGYSAISDAALALEEKILEGLPGEEASALRPSVQRSIEVLVRALDEGLAVS